MSYFDEWGEGCLTVDQLKSYLRQLIAELPGLFSIGAKMPVEEYITIASRKFIMLQGRNGKYDFYPQMPSELAVANAAHCLTFCHLTTLQKKTQIYYYYYI